MVNQTLNVAVTVVSLQLPSKRGALSGIHGLGQATIPQQSGVALEGALAEVLPGKDSPGCRGSCLSAAGLEVV